jgi:hypothetical protein
MINKTIEKGTHKAVLNLLYYKTNNSAYINILNEFRQFMKINNFTYISACHYLINTYNNLKN